MAYAFLSIGRTENPGPIFWHERPASASAEPPHRNTKFLQDYESETWNYNGIVVLVGGLFKIKPMFQQFLSSRPCDLGLLISKAKGET